MLGLFFNTVKSMSMAEIVPKDYSNSKDTFEKKSAERYSTLKKKPQIKNYSNSLIKKALENFN